MSTATTTIPLDECGRIAKQGFWQYQPTGIPDLYADHRTDFVAIEDLEHTARLSSASFGIRYVRTAALAVLIGTAQAVAENELSRPGISIDRMNDIAQLRSFRPNYAVADFIEPVFLKWNKSARRIRQAAKRFSDETHADY